MQLLDLPNELLLKIFEYGGTDALVGGVSQSCSRLREISNEPELWTECLAPQFRMQYMTPSQIDKIRDYREWCLRQRAATKRTTEEVDVIVSEMHECSPEDVEAYAWQILKLRLRATEGLEAVKRAPRTLAHYHWAHWLTEIMHRLEGVHLLLELSTQDNWGNDAVENPIDQIVALYTLRNGRFPVQLIDAVHYAQWKPSSLKSASDMGPVSAEAAYEAAAELVQHVVQIFSHITTRNDFLATLGRGSLFINLAMQAAPELGWSARLLKLPLGSLVCVQPANGPAFFVDFQREGKLRSLEEVKDRLNLTGAAGRVQYGISLNDTLATSYVWHTVPTTTRHCVLDLIEHAANDVNVTHLVQAPRLYSHLVRRIISRNVAEIENAPISRAVSSASLASMVGTSPGGWLRRGRIVRVLASQHEEEASEATLGETEGPPHFGVVLEPSEGSILVLSGVKLIRVIKQMLQPASHVPLTSFAGMTVPDIGADMCLLGQYFWKYNKNTERFE